MSLVIASVLAVPLCPSGIPKVLTSHRFPTGPYASALMTFGPRLSLSPPCSRFLSPASTQHLVFTVSQTCRDQYVQRRSHLQHRLPSPTNGVARLCEPRPGVLSALPAPSSPTPSLEYFSDRPLPVSPPWMWPAHWTLHSQRPKRSL